MRKSFTHRGVRYWVSGRTEKELEENLKLKKREVSRTGEDIKFGEWCWEWLETYKSDLNSNTIQNYGIRFKKFLLPTLGNLRLTRITHIHCQKILNKMKGYSANYIKKVYNDMHQVFEGAILNGYIEKNPVERTILPKGHVNKRRALTDSEKTIVLNTAKGHPAGVYIMLMLYCGLRPHETAFVQGKDIKGNILHIRGEKSENADRIVPIPTPLLPYLSDLKEEDYLIKSLSGDSPVKKHHRTKLWNSFKREIEKYLGSVEFTPYCLRHTYCTELALAGVPITSAKDLMGHSTIALTADVYTHKNLAAFRESAEIINAHYEHF